MARRYPKRNPLTEWEKTVLWLVDFEGGKRFKAFYDNVRRMERQPWRKNLKVGTADRWQARRLRQYESIKRKLRGRN